MSIKRKPTVIKLNQDEFVKFQQWAFGPSKPSKGINKARQTMMLAKNTSQYKSSKVRDRD